MPMVERVIFEVIQDGLDWFKADPKRFERFLVDYCELSAAEAEKAKIYFAGDTGYSDLFKELGQRVAEGNYEDPTFTVDLLVKDIKLAVQMAKDNSAPPVLARTVELINEMSQAQGQGDKDTAIMWTSYRGLWNG